MHIFRQPDVRFREGVERYLRGDGGHKDSVLLPVEVVFPEYGKIVILGANSLKE